MGAKPGNLQTKQCCFGHQGPLHTKLLTHFLRSSSIKTTLIMTSEKNVIITNIKYVHLSRYADHSWFIHLAILTF